MSLSTNQTSGGRRDPWRERSSGPGRVTIRRKMEILLPGTVGRVLPDVTWHLRESISKAPRGPG